MDINCMLKYFFIDPNAHVLSSNTRDLVNLENRKKKVTKIYFLHFYDFLEFRTIKHPYNVATLAVAAD